MHLRHGCLFVLMLILISATESLSSQNDSGGQPIHESELIFAPEHWHNHASCIVECPNGDLLVCWYHGSGERRADDVIVEGARRKRGESKWGPRFLMADTPGFPDTNPCMFIDPQKRLWLLWQTLIANEWHTALPKYKISTSYENDGPIKWEINDTMLLKPGPEFTAAINKRTDAALAKVKDLPEAQQERWKTYLEKRRAKAADPYFSRMGWMTRAHPYVLNGKRLIVPLYSDGYSISLMAISDDWGEHWETSQPLVGQGNIQPSLARKKDGTLVAYMRDNGPPPKRLMKSESTDDGKTWSDVVDTELFNPGSGAEVLVLKSGRWAMIYNDTEQGRHSMALSLSDDEGKSWKWTRHLEQMPRGPDATSGHYPSIIQAMDGSLHVTYTHTLNGANVKKDAEGKPMRESIKHARVNEAWVMEGKK